jgi:AraC-like DNA-binding protein
VQSYLQSRLHERLALDDLVAATSTLSRYHFIREYKRLTGQTPMQAFQHLKISRACYLLDVSDLGVSDIARHLGHDDPYYFSRLFKKVMGVAPRHYRRERSSH